MQQSLLELYSQGDIYINRLPVYHVSYSYIDPVLVGGQDLVFEKNIEDLFGSDLNLVTLEKDTKDHRYAACFDHENINVWTRAKENIMTSLSCLLSKHNSPDSNISSPDYFRPEPCDFMRAVSLFSQERTNIFTMNDILEILYITKSSDLIISFVNDLHSINSEDKGVIFKSNRALCDTEFLIAKSLYHILHRFANNFIFTFKNREVQFSKWSY